MKISFCKSMCIEVYLCVCAHVWVHVCWGHMCVSVCWVHGGYTCVCVHMCAWVYVCVSACMCECPCGCTSVSIHVLLVHMCVSADVCVSVLRSQKGASDSLVVNHLVWVRGTQSGSSGRAVCTICHNGNQKFPGLQFCHWRAHVPLWVMEKVWICWKKYNKTHFFKTPFPATLFQLDLKPQ